MPNFSVETIEAVVLDGPEQLLQCRMMSPYVWRGKSGARISLLVRAVPEEHSETGAGVSGVIWYASGDEDGLRFQSGDSPLMEPGPAAFDIGGCEDPTVVPTEQDCLVYYTGLNDSGKGELLYAEGNDIASLQKVGIAHASSRSERNTKEATVARTQAGDWRLLFEYSHDCRSQIGLAIGDGPSGGWLDRPDPVTARAGKWDCWHLSTGPILVDEPGGPLMFYNGADRDAAWGIGWVVLSEDCLTQHERCVEPLIAPKRGDRGDPEISFAASAIRHGDVIWLYFTRNDRALYRATIRRSDDETARS